LSREFDVTEDLEDALADGEVIDRREWRHGHRARILFDFDGHAWATWIDVHHSEGWQLTKSITATPMRKAEVTRTEWVEVQ
jgi:hypothetical protein